MEELTREDIKEIMEQVIDAKTKDFWIEREIHYKHHQFIGDLMDWSKNIKNTTLKAIITIVVSSIIGLIVLGFVFWNKQQ
ncbi:MAG: hypothetical protein A2W22_06305 [Candidatus Levybacteria bacterium RBG_16_35_11]|nr:MAG: hypothetical protein A2W22_06305 [Candidatus Levybacteria bacterium RBG_16_35_11]